MKCKKCNQENETDSVFCVKCGFNLNKGAESKVKSHTLRNIGLIIGVIAVVSFIGYSIAGNNFTTENNSNSTIVNDEWKPFTSVEHRMIVSFPKYPTSSREPKQKLDNGYSYSSTTYTSTDDNDAEYSITVGDYDIPSEGADIKAGLEGTINGMKGIIDITNTIFIKQNGFDAITFSFNSEDISGKGIAIIRDDLEFIKNYIFMVASKTGNIPDYQKFINSLEFN